MASNRTTTVNPLDCHWESNSSNITTERDDILCRASVYFVLAMGGPTSTDNILPERRRTSLRCR